MLGAIFTDKLICQQLTNLIWVGFDSALQDAAISEVARILHALGRGIARLKQYYDHLTTIELNPRDGFFPSVTSYQDAQQNIVSFYYVKALKSSPECVTFLATTSGVAPQRIVVKFVQRYGKDVHEFLAKQNFAPELLYFGKIDPCSTSPSYGALSMVVMEYLIGNTVHELIQAEEFDRIGTQSGFPASLKRIIEVLHSEGYVFGDLRPPNIIVVPEGVKLVDFDWAGRVDAVKYPPRMSADLSWPEGAARGELITMQHDLDMLGNIGSLCSNNQESPSEEESPLTSLEDDESLHSPARQSTF